MKKRKEKYLINSCFMASYSEGSCFETSPGNKLAKRILINKLGVVVSNCNSSYTEGICKEHQSPRLAPGKSVRPTRNVTTTTLGKCDLSG
jgi:hypothetical protein